MRNKYWMDYKELLKEIVEKTRRDDFSLFEDDDKKEIALAWLESPKDKYEAAALLLDTIALTSQDWIGHFIKRETKEMADVILTNFVEHITKYKCINNDLGDAYMELFAENFEDPAPKHGGRTDEVL